MTCQKRLAQGSTVSAGNDAHSIIRDTLVTLTQQDVRAGFIVEQIELMLLDKTDESVAAFIHRYLELLSLPHENLHVTTSRNTYANWIGRRVPSAYGGAYCFDRRTGVHAVLINLDRIDRTKPHAIEVVVAEELLHMRDYLDGDRRRHAHHGYDRIATRVSALTGVSLTDIRSALIPPTRRPFKYRYQCPGCQVQVRRRKRGTCSCGRCSPRFDSRFVLKLVNG